MNQIKARRNPLFFDNRGWHHETQRSSYVLVKGVLGGFGTTSGYPEQIFPLDRSESTSSGQVFEDQSSSTSNQQAVSELRLLSGLTWEQLAELFGVSRRSIHFWASGEPLSKKNEEKLQEVLSVVRFIDRGFSRQNRELLAQKLDNGVSCLELLTQSDYQKVKELLGKGKGRKKRELPALSEAEKTRRKPPKPDELISEYQDPIPQKKMKARVPKVARRKKA